MLTKIDKLFGLLGSNLNKLDLDTKLESYSETDRTIFWSLDFICCNDFQNMPRQGKLNVLAALMDLVTPEGIERLKVAETQLVSDKQRNKESV